jgi:hypothetical protein
MIDFFCTFTSCDVPLLWSACRVNVVDFVFLPPRYRNHKSRINLCFRSIGEHSSGARVGSPNKRSRSSSTTRLTHRSAMVSKTKMTPKLKKVIAKLVAEECFDVFTSTAVTSKETVKMVMTIFPSNSLSKNLLKCSGCGEVGHNCRTCECWLVASLARLA